MCFLDGKWGFGMILSLRKIQSIIAVLIKMQDLSVSETSTLEA